MYRHNFHSLFLSVLFGNILIFTNKLGVGGWHFEQTVWIILGDPLLYLTNL